jgi:hypothetical protein
MSVAYLIHYVIDLIRLSFGPTSTATVSFLRGRVRPELFNDALPDLFHAIPRRSASGDHSTKFNRHPLAHWSGNHNRCWPCDLQCQQGGHPTNSRGVYLDAPSLFLTIPLLPLQYSAGWLAAQAFFKYRRAGGKKESPLPDFYMGGLKPRG